MRLRMENCIIADREAAANRAGETATSGTVTRITVTYRMPLKHRINGMPRSGSPPS